MSTTGAVLTKECLKKRLSIHGDLVISPILEPDLQIGDGSVDIRLGTHFVMSQRSQMTEIDPLDLTVEKLRKFHHAVVVSFEERFMLHPGSFCLGCTFEFIALPTDISGFVLSRSNYGRAGLLIATATYVHPGWHGCLTLELENLGEVPIALWPGSRVGQLVLMQAERISEKPKLKSIPIAPSFSSLAENEKWNKLRGQSVSHFASLSPK